VTVLKSSNEELIRFQLVIKIKAEKEGLYFISFYFFNLWFSNCYKFKVIYSKFILCDFRDSEKLCLTS